MDQGKRHDERARGAGHSLLIALIVAGVAIASIAQENKPELKPENKPADSTRPLLKQLNEETQSLYHEVQAGVYRVQLPPPKWVAGPALSQDEENPIRKWSDRLGESMKRELEAEQKRMKQGQASAITATVQKAATQPVGAATQATQSTTQAAVGSWTLSTGGDDVLIFRPGPGGGGALQFDAGGGISKDGQIIASSGRLQVNVGPGGSFTPNNIGLLLDGEGHMLVPICVEKESFDGEIPVMLGDGQMNSARFVGSDRQTNVTVLKLSKPLGTPVKLSKSRPMPGNLTMFLSPNTGVGRLIIWTTELRDWGVVVSMDGSVYGFTRQGQFLSAAGCRPVIDQLIKAGAVRRAKLGLGIVEVAMNDAQREKDALLGQQPAVRVNEIALNGLAKAAGFVADDVIVTLNGQPVGDPAGFAAALSADDEKASFKVLREGREAAITIQLSGQGR